MKFGIVNRSNGGLFRYQGWPTVCRDENGVLYVVCSGSRLGHVCPFGKNLMYVSYDEGKTWSCPMIVNDTVLDDRDGGILSLGDGKLLLTYFDLPREFYYNHNVWLNHCMDPVIKNMALGLVDGWKSMSCEQNRAGSFVRLSRDGGKTWGEAVKVPVTSPHGPIRLKNGKLLFVGKIFCDDSYEDGALYAFESTDDGQSWSCLSNIAVPNGINNNQLHELHAVELENGRIVVAIRAHGNATKYDLGVMRCFSDDGGRTWSLPEPLDVCGSPPHLLLHSSGALVMTYGRREVPYGQRARISYDGGISFGEEITIGERSNDSDLGYPSTVELSDGSLMTVYYQKLPNDDFCSILYTQWAISEK